MSMRYRYPQRIAIKVKAWVPALSMAILGIVCGVLGFLFVELLFTVQRNHWVVVAIFVPIELLFLHGLWLSYRALRLPGPGLVIDRIGIDSNLGGRPWNRITWREIKSIKGFGAGNGKWLVIQVYRLDRFRRMGGPLWRAMRMVDMLVCGSPITINTTSLDMSFKEILELAQSYHRESQDQRDRTV